MIATADFSLRAGNSSGTGFRCFGDDSVAPLRPARPVVDSENADLPAWRCLAGSVDLVWCGRLRGNATAFVRGCVRRLSLSQSSTNLGFRFRFLIDDATGLPCPRTRIECTPESGPVASRGLAHS